ncbi:hypothetical protein O181_010142 [Austropuccinia psidii MF-1]|uniref:Uncharacterized protein n=1 Tax=Austropuccinia psidii MF-1 TaxID=1389203 RepID=A0A9Q3GKX9_9BASI|nr:hypothetical protein [Austropuccinia psidii MF-1]
MSCTLYTKRAHKKFLFVVKPFQSRGERRFHPRWPHQDSFVVNNDESIPEGEWIPGPQTGRRERFQKIILVPSSIYLSTPPPRPPSNGHFTPQLEHSDYPTDEGWQWQDDIQAWAKCHHVLSPVGFKHQKQSPLNPPQQETAVPHMPYEQTLWEPSPGPKPSQHHEPPIPGLNQFSKPQVPSHEDALTCEPEPEVAPTQSTEEPFGKSPLHLFYSSLIFLTPPSIISSLSHSTPPVIIINDTPIGSPSPFSFHSYRSFFPKDPSYCS